MINTEKQDFDAPIPGESLTHELGSQPDEKPPEYTDPGDAYEYVSDRLFSEEAMTRLAISGELGVPLELTIRAVVFAGWAEGKYTIDTMYLIYGPMLELAMTMLESLDVPYVLTAERDEETDLKDAMELLRKQREHISGESQVEEKKVEKPIEEEEEAEGLGAIEEEEEPQGGLMGRPVG